MKKRLALVILTIAAVIAVNAPAAMAAIGRPSGF
jgi:hypothetical protein